MAAPSGSLFSTHSERIEEIINKSIGVFLPSLDPVWEDTVTSNMSVQSTGDQFGRDWKILKVFYGGLTGVIEGGGPKADFPLYGDNQDTALGEKLHLKGLSNTFPDATKGPNPTPYRLGIPMRSMVTNIMLTLGEMQADATPAFIGEVVAPKLDMFARNIAQTLCLYYYLSQNSFYALTSINTSATDYSADARPVAAADKVLQVDLKGSNYAVNRFMVGQRVQIYDSTGATVRASSGSGTELVVVAVDELRATVQLRWTDGGDVSAAMANNDIIVLANTKGSATTPFSASPYFTGIAGINSWLKTGGGSGDNVLLGDESDGSNEIDVTVHPEFKSMGYSLGSAPLTEHTLRKILRRFHMAKERYGHEIDTLLASDGVWLAYEATRIGRETVDRTGRTASLSNQGLKKGFSFEMDGRSYRGMTSGHIETGVVYGQKFRGKNWTQYVPPDPKNVMPDSRNAPYVPFRFVGKALSGGATNTFPILDSSGTHTLMTEGTQMPGWLRLQMVPEQIPGLKLTSVAEDRVYADN